MTNLDPRKLHSLYKQGEAPLSNLVPRKYTLTHSVRTGDLFLMIGREYDQKQISGFYTRFMRDEVLAEWVMQNTFPELHVHCHVSGGLILGSASWRTSIFEHHMPQVLQAFRHGDDAHFRAHPELDQAPIQVHFHARQARHQRIVDWGTCADFRLTA